MTINPRAARYTLLAVTRASSGESKHNTDTGFGVPVATADPDDAPGDGDGDDGGTIDLGELYPLDRQQSVAAAAVGSAWLALKAAGSND